MGLLPIHDAARMLGIEPKRLRGYMFRNKVGDPIGDAEQVYGWSLKTLADRISPIKAVVQP
jgi:ribosome-binding protein aMBF1 (putative translation factor)